MGTKTSTRRAAPVARKRGHADASASDSPLALPAGYAVQRRTIASRVVFVPVRERAERGEGAYSELSEDGRTPATKTNERDAIAVCIAAAAQRAREQQLDVRAAKTPTRTDSDEGSDTSNGRLFTRRPRGADLSSAKRTAHGERLFEQLTLV